MEKLDFDAPVILQGNDIWWGTVHIRIGVDLEIEATWKFTGMDINIVGLTDKGREFNARVGSHDMMEILCAWMQRHRFGIGQNDRRVLFTAKTQSKDELTTEHTEGTENG